MSKNMKGSEKQNRVVAAGGDVEEGGSLATGNRWVHRLVGAIDHYSRGYS